MQVLHNRIKNVTLTEITPDFGGNDLSSIVFTFLCFIFSSFLCLVRSPYLWAPGLVFLTSLFFLFFFSSFLLYPFPFHSIQRLRKKQSTGSMSMCSGDFWWRTPIRRPVIWNDFSPQFLDFLASSTQYWLMNLNLSFTVISHPVKEKH